MKSAVSAELCVPPLSSEAPAAERAVAAAGAPLEARLGQGPLHPGRGGLLHDGWRRLLVEGDLVLQVTSEAPRAALPGPAPHAVRLGLHAQEGGQVQVKATGAPARQRGVLPTLGAGDPHLVQTEKAADKGCQLCFNVC